MIKNYSIHPYTVQSYFKGLCKNFCIPFREIKRLEKQIKELERTHKDDIAGVLSEYINIIELGKASQSYIKQRYPKEELHKKKELLESRIAEYDSKREEYSADQEFWCRRFAKLKEDLKDVICQIKTNEETIIVTSKEEVITLMYFYKNHNVTDYDIINTDARYLSSYPLEDKMCEEFLKAYLADKEEKERGCSKILEVYEKYF